MQKIMCWAKAGKAANAVKKIDDKTKKLIPLGIRKDIYIRTVVNGIKEYHQELMKYAKKHKLN